MTFNVEFFKKFIEKYFNGNLTRCAKAINVNNSTISRICRKESNPGLNFVKKVIEYCAENGIEYSNFLQMPLQNYKTKRDSKII